LDGPACCQTPESLAPSVDSMSSPNQIIHTLCTFDERSITQLLFLCKQNGLFFQRISNATFKV
jgi:hypothetical protein